MRDFSLLIKPSSHGCNLRCDYCFYLEKKKYYPEKMPKMSEQILEQMIKTFQSVPMRVHAYGWQGGEPLTMGLDFFKKAAELQQKHGRGGQPVSNGMQTNGTLIDDEWAAHLAKYKFLVGLSCDGPAEIHNPNRPTIGGEGSHEYVMKGRDALIRHNVDYNILTVVNNLNCNQPIETYRYIRDDLQQNFHQYIECVEFDQHGKLMPYAVRGRQFGEFMCAIFDEWYANDVDRVSVRLFDTILAKLVDNVANSCTFASDCRQYMVVEHNGDVFPCDFYVDPDRWRLGNVMTDSWEDMWKMPLYEEFGLRKSQRNPKCEQCQFLQICQGCCPKNRWGHGEDPRSLSVLCEGWEIFYAHTLPRFKELANKIRKRREQERQAMEMERRRMMGFQNRVNAVSNSGPAVPGGAVTNKKVGRNDPCSCGSGKKFKKCCGK